MPESDSKVQPHTREAQMFPRLDAATIDRLMPYGEIETPVTGMALFERGTRAADFFVVLDGAIELSKQKGASDRHSAKDGTAGPV